MIKIEVFRNNPPGLRCNLLTRAVLQAAASLKDDVEIKLVGFPSEYSKERGIKSAPALIINDKLMNGVIFSDNPTVEELKALKPEDILKYIMQAPRGLLT